MNSAARLNHFIEALFDFTDGGRPLNEFIVSYYKLPSAKDPQFYSRFSRILALPSEAERLVRLHPKSMPSKTHLTWVKSVNVFFSDFSPGIQLNQLKTKISEPTRHILALVAHTADGIIKSPAIAEKELNEIGKTITDLIENIRNATDLTERARDYLLEQCYRLESCLDDIAFFGDDIAGVKLQAAYGSIVRSTVEAKEISGHTLGKQFWEIAEKLSVLYALYDLGTALPVGAVIERLSN